MGFNTDFTCEVCQEDITEMVGTGKLRPTVCKECRALEENYERKEHFKKLDKLSIEERLRIVEKWIYDYKPKYVSPPRY